MRWWLLFLVVATIALLSLFDAVEAPHRSRRATVRREPRDAEREQSEGDSTTVEEGVEVSVTVLDDATGEPVPGARALLFGPGEYATRLLAQGVTNEQGVYAVTLTAPWLRAVVAYAEGYEPGESEGAEEQVRLRRRDPMEFVVVDGERRPLPDATAAPYHDCGHVGPAVRADMAGRISIRGSEFLVSAPRFASRVVDREETVVVLEDGFEVAGRVTDSAGAPLAGARVKVVQGSGCVRPLYQPEDVTGPDGRFSCGGLSSDCCTLYVYKRGYCRGRVWTSSGEQHADVVLFRAGRIAWQVLHEDGSPAVDAVVGLDRMELMVDDDSPADSATFGKGEVASGKHVLWAHDQGRYARLEITLTEGETRTGASLVLRPSPPPQRSYVRVRVLDPRGRPVAGAKVARSITDDDGVAVVESIQDPGWQVEIDVEPPLPLCREAAGDTITVPTAATTQEARLREVRLRAPLPLEIEVVDTQGRSIALRDPSIFGRYAFKVGPLRWLVHPEGLYSLHLHADGYASRFPGDLKPGRHRLVMYPPGVVTGRLVDERGRPVAGATVAGATSGPDGRFRVTGLNAHTNMFFPSRCRIPEAVLEIEVPLGQDVDVGDVVLRPPRKLRGRVLDRHGEPLGGAEIVARPYLADGRGWPFTASHRDGSFSMRVAAATRFIIVRKPGHGTRALPVEGPLTVSLPEPGRLLFDGAHDKRLGWPAPDGGVLWDEWLCEVPGHYDLAPGPIHVQFEGEEPRVVKIVAGMAVRVRPSGR